MKTKRAKALKPKIMYGNPNGYNLYHSLRQDDTAYLCIPLTPASKRKMVEVMGLALCRSSNFPAIAAKDALAALESMASHTKE